MNDSQKIIFCFNFSRIKLEHGQRKQSSANTAFKNRKLGLTNSNREILSLNFTLRGTTQFQLGIFQSGILRKAL